MDGVTNGGQVIESILKRSQGKNLYVLADAAQDRAIPAALRVASRSLFGEGAVAEVSPHLLDMPRNQDAPGWRWIGRNAPIKPCVVILASGAAFGEMFDHLQRFLDVQVTANTSMHLAFWDPAILATLIGQPDDDTLHVKEAVFTVEQRTAFFRCIHHAWYWDRRGSLRHVQAEAAEQVTDQCDEGVANPLPLSFNRQQVDRLVKAAVPDQVLYELRLNRPGVLEGRDEYENYAMSSRMVTAAYEMNIRGLRDLVNFVGTGMILGESFYRHAAIEPYLRDVVVARQRFTEALAEIPNEALEDVMRICDGQLGARMDKHGGARW